MITAVHAEWTKLRTVTSPAWLLLTTVVVTVGLSAAAIGSALCRTDGCGLDPVRTSLTGVLIGQAVVAVLGVLAMGGEYSAGMIGTTLAAMPGRAAVLVAKAITTVVPVLAAGVLAVAGSAIAGRILLPGSGFTTDNGFAPLSPADSATLRAMAGTVLYLGLVAVLSVGVGAIVRNSAAAIGIVLGLLFLFPILTSVVTDPDWQRFLRRIAPSDAGLAIQSTVAGGSQPIGPWAGLGVCAAWAGAALLAGAVALRCRDA